MLLATIVGARPQFIKAAAVSAAIRHLPGSPVEEMLIHTGQHYDESMSDVFFEELRIPPPGHHLGIGSGSHGAQTGEMMRALEEVILSSSPDAVMVYGDTNSTLAGALVAAKMDLPLVHVEAGLRSGVRAMPEEVNRVVTDHVATMLLCPCERAVRQLAAEGINSGVHDVGDVMFDVLVANLDRAVPLESTLRAHGVERTADRLALATVHRPSNTDAPARFQEIVEGLGDLAAQGWDIVWPVHPRIARRLDVSEAQGVHLVEPLSYLELLGVLRAARLVATDSGGVQREAFWLGVPCLTLRSETEWPETVDSGFNRLWNPSGETLLEAAEAVASGRERAGKPPSVYGAGDAAERIARLLTSAV